MALSNLARDLGALNRHSLNEIIKDMSRPFKNGTRTHDRRDIKKRNSLHVNEWVTLNTLLNFNLNNYVNLVIHSKNSRVSFDP